MEVSVRYYSAKEEDEKTAVELSEMSTKARREKKKEAEKSVRKKTEVKSEKKAEEPKEEAYTSDAGQKIIDSLSDKQRAVFEEIPLDRPITVDGLMKLGFSMGEIMSSLTILEIKGLISSLPGALYIRK